MINLSSNIINNDILIKNIIINLKKKISSNSFIFSGPKGIGKASAAFYIISNIYKNLEYNKLDSTNHIYSNSHPNIKYLTKQHDTKTNKLKQKISIDQIRDLKFFLNKSTFDNFPKFIIIDSADDLNISSSNALLKSLEEPNDNTYFILIAHQISGLLTTIKSRCINFIFEKPNHNEFIKILNKVSPSIDSTNVDFLFYITNSSPGLALEIYSENIWESYRYIIEIFSNKDDLFYNITNLTNLVSNYTNDEFRYFLILLKFIIISFIKINLGYKFDITSNSNLLNLCNMAKYISNISSLEILKFINENERDLFIYNLDKKVFCFNIFNNLNA